MSNEPLLSIITVSAFDGDRLTKTLNSLVGLPASVEHILVIPETDSQSEVIWNSFRNNVIHSMTLIRDRQQGVYEAMNLGATESRGKYICYWNAGDRLNSSQDLSSVLIILHESNPAWVICQAHFEWRESQEISMLNLNGFVTHKPDSFISHQTIIVKRTTFMKIGMFDCRYRVAADTAQITKLLLLIKPLLTHSIPVEVESPKFAADNHRLARVEVFVIVLRELDGKKRLTALKNILISEIRRFKLKLE